MESEALELVTKLCLRFEGMFLHPYLCPAGVVTIGAGSTVYEDGTKVTLHDPFISEERAISLLELTLKRDYMPAVKRLCPDLETAGQLAALTDFAYNAGVGALKNSTLRKKVNAKDYEAVPRELAKWAKGGGKILKGLVIRRQAEAKMFAG